MVRKIYSQDNMALMCLTKQLKCLVLYLELLITLRERESYGLYKENMLPNNLIATKTISHMTGARYSGHNLTSRKSTRLVTAAALYIPLPFKGRISFPFNYILMTFNGSWTTRGIWPYTNLWCPFLHLQSGVSNANTAFYTKAMP